MSVKGVKELRLWLQLFFLKKQKKDKKKKINFQVLIKYLEIPSFQISVLKFTRTLLGVFEFKKSVKSKYKTEFFNR